MTSYLIEDAGQPAAKPAPHLLRGCGGITAFIFILWKNLGMTAFYFFYGIIWDIIYLLL